MNLVLSTRLRACAGSLLFLLLLSPSVRAQREPQGRTPPAHVLAAQAFLLLAYPDLVNRPITMTMQPQGSGLVVSVEDADDPLQRPRGAVPSPVVVAAMEFTASGQLRSFAASGALVNDVANRALRDQLLEHPEWTEAQAASWLRANGAAAVQSAPDDVTRLTSPRWQAFLGTNVQTGASAFAARESSSQGQPPVWRPRPGWEVQVSATASAGAASYRLVFEPFGGRLVAVTRQ